MCAEFWVLGGDLGFLPARRFLSVFLWLWPFLDLDLVPFLDLDLVPFLELLVVY